MSKLLYVFMAVLACMVCAHKVPTGEGIEVLSLTNMSFATTGDWLLVLYAPWCPHCTNVLDKIPAVAEKIKEMNGHALIGIIDADAEPAIQMQFSMHGFPSIFMAHDGEVYEFPSSLGRSVESLAEFAVNGYSKETPISGIKAPFGLVMRAFGLYSAFAIGTYRFLEVYAQMLQIPPMWFFCGIAALLVVFVIILVIVCSRCRQPKKCPAPRKAGKKNNDSAIAAPIIQGERAKNPIEGAAIAETENVQDKVKKAKKDQEIRRRAIKEDKEGIREEQKNAQRNAQKKQKNAKGKGAAHQQNRPTQQPSKRS